MRLFVIFSTFLCGLVGLSLAQETPDSTNWGAKTTRYFYVEDLHRGVDSLSVVDTTLENFHLFEYNTWGINPYQTLGTHGTAAQSLVPIHSPSLGHQLGRTVYTPYLIRDYKHYDTYSPYSKVNFHITGNGVEVFKGGFTRNFGSRFNAGIEFNRIASKSLFGVSLTEERIVNHYSGRFFGSYQSYSGIYNAFLDYSFMDHKVVELGGVVLDTALSYEESVFRDIAQEKLINAQTWEKNNEWKFKHFVRLLSLADSTKPNEGVFVYHDFHKERRKLQYIDKNVANNEKYFNDTSFTSGNSFKDSTVFTQFENELGLRLTKDVFTASVFVKNRQVHYDVQDSLNDFHSETYAGADVTLYLPSRKARFSGNYTWSDKGYHRYQAGIYSNYGNVSYSSSINPPNLFSTFYHGGYNQWANQFSDVQTNVLLIQPSLTVKKRLTLAPFYKLTTIDQYQYFDLQGEAAQHAKGIEYSNLGFSYRLKALKRIVLSGKYSINNVNEDKILRLPKTLIHQQVYYAGDFKKVALRYKVGVDASYRSKYFADAYNPSIFQYHIQDDYEVKAYWMFDVWAQIQVKNRFTLFMRMKHINQRSTSEVSDYLAGYQETPLYRGNKRALEVGVNWLFFD